MTEQHSPETMAAFAVMQQFISEAGQRGPHVAIDSLLTMAERMEREQGGRLADMQVRTFAAFLMGAARLPADQADPEIVPEWLTEDDAERYAAGAALVPPDTPRSPAMTAH